MDWIGKPCPYNQMQPCPLDPDKCVALRGRICYAWMLDIEALRIPKQTEIVKGVKGKRGRPRNRNKQA